VYGAIIGMFELNNLGAKPLGILKFVGAICDPAGLHVKQGSRRLKTESRL